MEWYREFVDPEYKTKKSDLIAYYYFKPARGFSKKDVVGRIASESSIGTWTTLSTLTKKIYDYRARAFWMRGDYVKIAYPLQLWEPGNIPQLLSGVAGNIFGMAAIKKLKLLDVQFSKEYLKAFKGPNYGVRAIKKIFHKKEGPIIATVPKPKVNDLKSHLKIAYEAWIGGVDCIKDDENLASLSFNKFEERVRGMAKIRDRVERESGEVKDAFINVTSPTLYEMERRIALLHDYGFKYFMLDLVVSGFTAVQTAAELARDYDMAIHGHRAMHAAFTRYDHGISMLFLAKIARIAGVDNLHIGTGVGKMAGSRKEVLAIKDVLVEKEVKGLPKIRLEQNFFKIGGSLPVASGGLHPGILPALFKVYKSFDICVQVGGGIHGHPKGTRAGAIAVVQAINAIRDGISLKEAAKSHKELREALEKWGYVRPK